MTARYELLPAAEHPRAKTAFAYAKGECFWHKQGGNGEIVAVSEIYSTHDHGVQGIRDELEVTAEILGISEKSYQALYAVHLVYDDGVFGLQDVRLYPDDRPTAAAEVEPS